MRWPEPDRSRRSDGAGRRREDDGVPLRNTSAALGGGDRAEGRMDNLALHNGTAHALAAHALAARELAAREFAMASRALASGSGHGGHHLRIILIVVAVIVVAIIGWIVLSARTRRKRGES
jgi:hypothetical protein